MLVSLGLGSMSDVRFDPVRVDEILDRFMDHDYAPDGKGGLFTIRNPRFDMRSMEIWYQMNRCRYHCILDILDYRNWCDSFQILRTRKRMARMRGYLERRNYANLYRRTAKRQNHYAHRNV